MRYEADGSRRVVVLQTEAQARHYSEYKRKDGDLVIPIGPEAMYHAEQRGWVTCNLGELWSSEDYRRASDESQSRIDGLIDALDAYSKDWNPDLGLEIGRYYALQLWVIIGQIHYNYFIAHSIARHLQPTSLLVYTKDIGQPFLELRPDPDCIFAEVLLRSGCINAEQIEIQRIGETRRGRTTTEKIVNVLPQALATRIRELRTRWRIRNAGKSTYRLLLIGAGYDWLKISRFEGFRDEFSLHILPRPQTTKIGANPPTEFAGILNGAVEYAGNTVYDLRNLASTIHADLVLYAERNEEINKQLKRYDAVVTAVLTYPWESYVAHMAAKMNIPVVVWQHGEKGQAWDVTGLYTELFYATDYLAYAPAVQRQHQSWIGQNRLANVEAVGSIGKNVVWRGGATIVYATGKWFKTAAPFVPKSDPDKRLFDTHRTILGYLDTVVATERPVIFKANNTPGLNAAPYQYENIRVDYATPFTALLETAGVVILDTPTTTLVEACSTRVPIFVLGGRTEYYQEFLEVVRRRVIWCENQEELVMELDSYLRTGRYGADLNDDTYFCEYCAASEPDEVVRRVKKNLLRAIKRQG
jgi:hypothetical protein